MANYVQASKLHFDGLLSPATIFMFRWPIPDDPVWQNLFEDMYDAKRLYFPLSIATGNHEYDHDKYP